MSYASDLIDAFLADTKYHSLVDAGVVRDLLLDIRLAIADSGPQS